MMVKSFKLSIELIPSTIWYANLYNYYKSKNQMEKWHELKQYLFETEGNHCWICRRETKYLEAHEFFEYDDFKHIQKVAGVHHLCNLCHKIKHIGLWCHSPDGHFKLKKEGLSREDLIRHFCLVNNCSEQDFYKHEDEAFALWKKRSSHNWNQDLWVYGPQFGLKELKSQQKLRFMI